MNDVMTAGGIFSDSPTLASVSIFFFVMGFAASLVVTRPLIGWLQTRQLGKAIRVDGPDHRSKTGTPTMGGVGMLGILLFFTLWKALGPAARAEGDGAVSARVFLLVAASLLVFAAFGLIDDLAGLARRSGRKELGVGLGAKQMLLLQLLASFALSALALRWLGADTISGGLLPASIALPGGFLLATFGLLGTVNGVNFSDGLDGLAAGLLATAFAATTWILLADFGTLALLSALAAGACLGFLWYNRHPARVFMGNVSSMGMGGALAMIYIVSGLWWLLPIVGAVFVAEVLSDIIQIAYFKWSGGKRVFRMAPLHHHFELGGLHETQVVRRFWIAGALAGLLAIALFVRFVA